VAITTGARHAAHIITLIIDLVVIGGLCAYVTYKAKDRDYPPSKWHKWGPSILCWIAFPLIMADPLRHTLNDYNIWEGCTRSCHETWPNRCNWSSEEYKCVIECGSQFSPPFNNVTCNVQPDGSYPVVDSCSCVATSQERINHLSPMGILFTIVLTYFGFGLFMAGNLWNADIVGKCRDIKHQYRVLRGLSEDDAF